ncbi:MAG: polyhydroxyalkanoic acid system family protein [Thermoguttaceae bacterium]
MPRLSLQIPHNLGREEATRRIQEQLPKVRGQVADLDEQWQDHTLTFHFTVLGQKVGGTLAVEETAAIIDVDLPLAALMVKGMIEQRVRQELGTVLA